MSTPEIVRKTDTDLDFCSYRHEMTGEQADGKPWPKLTIDGQVVAFKPGDTIMQAAERMKMAADIPRFCYHPAMPIAGTCRMCTVEVEKAPKLMTSCSTPAADGMVVQTKSPKVLKSRDGVMEFLLANHPLDCPVCDKAGECDLQDYDFEYGPSTSRFKEEKRVFEENTTKHLSDKIVLNMNRCVHCERCVRFTEDVTKTHDLVMLNRGWKKELSAADEEKGLWNDYQGNLADFCPVGALTFTDFRFEKRVWFLKKDASVCDKCSKGCNIEVHSEKEVVYRYQPVFNEKVNGHWMCDEGRVSYHTYADTSRIVSPLIPSQQGELAAVNWETALQKLGEDLKRAQRPLVIIGTDATLEEAKQLQDLLPQFNRQISFKFHSGFGNGSQDNKALDHLLRQSDKTPNTKGLESLGLKVLAPQDSKAADLVIFVRNGRAKITDFGVPVWAWGIFNRQELKELGAGLVKGCLPGLATIEKEGTFINCDGIAQKFKRAVNHRGNGLSVSKVLSLLIGEKR
jgi:NADH-quinone oxidoreductase subunit G